MRYPAVSKRSRSRAACRRCRRGKRCAPDEAADARLRHVTVEAGARRIDICSRSPPPVSHHSRICGRRWEQAPRRTSARGAFGPHRAPPHPRARHRAPGHRSRSTCAASHRARSRDRARSSPLRRADARRRPRAPRDAARAAVAGRPSGRVPARVHRAIPRRPRPDAIRSARRAGDPQTDEDAATDLDPGRFEIVERGVERGRRDLMRLDDQCRLPSRDLQIGKRQHVRRRQALREMVHKRPHPFVVHRAVVYRDQLVASHQAEAPPGGSVMYRVPGLRAAGNRGRAASGTARSGRRRSDHAASTRAR